VATWAGAIIDGASVEELSSIAERFRLDVAPDATSPVLVHAAVGYGSFQAPSFAQELSRELGCQVIGFVLQTTASVEEVEHWQDGHLVRRLVYSADAGGWLTREGVPQAWETVYFFPPGDDASSDEKWPGNLYEEISDEDLQRYRQARAARDASSVLDLLTGGSADALERLCRHFGVDPDRPSATYQPPKNYKPMAALLLVVLVLVLGAVLGALTAR